MTAFPKHTLETAPDEVRPLLETSRKMFGRIPGLHATMAESPALLRGYQELFSLAAHTRFSTTERHVAWLALNYENGCTYCMAAHTGLAKKDRVDDAIIQALRDGRPLADAKLEALRRLAVRLVRDRGWVDEDGLRPFLDAGYTRGHVLDLVLLVGAKTLSNYTNHLAETPVDDAVKPFAWTPPDRRQAAE
ncbi:carboxymuconolactone decarboxylase family protein [Roseospira visakhapatnamensis]|uniref:AhpD family alkylhydroperoxidase n=1 Tax=Roseospira visakhapatnamensis TaxID=390880 RepID=A0A7W6W944_9PROT|nr:carboxymuconolactone decarboxylase family protein [Roseospira visakhapatnamensis]MBB4265086.1 AhpD family alkylhydroperoxidase [Roseospira visakhapatnamensis]